MATYIARDKNGNQVNIIEIMPEQIPAWEQLTGLTCELPVREEIIEGSEETPETIEGIPAAPEEDLTENNTTME